MFQGATEVIIKRQHSSVLKSQQLISVQSLRGMARISRTDMRRGLCLTNWVFFMHLACHAIGSA